MQKFVIISAILAYTTAAPALFIEDNAIHYPVDHGTLIGHEIHDPIIPIYHEISSKKSTLTKSSQVVNHGGTAVLHAPIYETYPVMYSEVKPIKTTVTKSNQIVNHGGSTLVHAPVLPVVHAPVVHAPVLDASVLHAPVLHAPVYYSAPMSVKSGDSAISHQSSTVHETVPVVNHLPLYALH